MAEQANRLYKRKRIKFSDNNYVDIPVIYQAIFKTMADQAQEHIFYFDNSLSSSRKTHTKKVYNVSNAAAEAGVYIDCERIDQFFIKTAQEQAQDYSFFMSNNDPPPIKYDGSNNPAHQRVHYVRYFKDNDQNSGIYVDCELIDELRINDGVSQGQEWIYYMLHPQLGDTIEDSSVHYVVTKGYCDPSLELVADQTGIDPPYRLDPFQNIVNLSDEMWITIGFQHSTEFTGPIGSGGPFDLEDLGSRFYGFGYASGLKFIRQPSAASGTFTRGGTTFTYSGANFTGASTSFDPWLVLHPSDFYGTTILASASKATAAGGRYVDYPTPGANKGNWVETTSVDLSGYVWKGTGPKNWYKDNPAINSPGMASTASTTQMLSDSGYPSHPEHVNLSIFSYGDLVLSGDANFSGLLITSSGGSTYSPVALSVSSLARLDETVVNGALGGVTVLCKKNLT